MQEAEAAAEGAALKLKLEFGDGLRVDSKAVFLTCEEAWGSGAGILVVMRSTTGSILAGTHADLFETSCY